MTSISPSLFRTRIEQDFDQFHEQHPEVFDLFKDLAQQAMDSGESHWSADAILHVVRWRYMVEQRRLGFKINNNFSAHYARLLIERCPRFDGFFELRKLRSAS